MVAAAFDRKCNLYSITTNQEAIRALFRYVATCRRCRAFSRTTPAPAVRNSGSERELAMMRWGMPPPPRAGGFPVTNIRDTSSPHWRLWLKLRTGAWSQPTASPNMRRSPKPEAKKKHVVWFAIDDDRPLTCFAGIWTELKGDRGTKSKPFGPEPKPRA
jgi:putative SOS response-associated peptidase YedK